MLAGRKNVTFRIGATGNLQVRVAQDKARAVDGFTKPCGANRLVWFERR